MAIQQIQQLEHDGKRLYCPPHSERTLVAAITQSASGTYMIVCTGGSGIGGACVRSVEWQTEAERDQYLAQTSELSG
jgi:hypothetical protein